MSTNSNIMTHFIFKVSESNCEYVLKLCILRNLVINFFNKYVHACPTKCTLTLSGKGTEIKRREKGLWVLTRQVLCNSGSNAREVLSPSYGWRNVSLERLSILLKIMGLLKIWPRSLELQMFFSLYYTIS